MNENVARIKDIAHAITEESPSRWTEPEFYVNQIEHLVRRINTEIEFLKKEVTPIKIGTRILITMTATSTEEYIATSTDGTSFNLININNGMMLSDPIMEYKDFTIVNIRKLNEGITNIERKP